jgi:glutamate synthase (NADPH/NADH) large chain
MDLSALLDDGEVAADVARTCQVDRNPPHDRGALAARISAATSTAVDFAAGGEFEFAIRNHDRSIGARLSGEIARRTARTV